MPAPSPALFSTRTWWPLRVSSRTVEGTRPTRYSLSLISFGTPTSIFAIPNVTYRAAPETGFGRAKSTSRAPLWPLPSIRRFLRHQSALLDFRHRVAFLNVPQSVKRGAPGERGSLRGAGREAGGDAGRDP